jgi:D-beta-D-heptose 7-phosphate kinase/D-beta-D-heptose 1-phosphate adenosyltransferase
MTDLKNTQQRTKYKILLIGDNCTDIYQYGTVDRLSPEAPVPIFVPAHREERDGMAGNVFANLKALGCDVNIFCGTSSKKTRLIDNRSRQQILRIDEDVKSIPIVNVECTGYDAVVISDYNKGVVSYELIEKIIQQSNYGVNFPVFIDTKKVDLERMQGAWVKINELEYSKIKSECSGLIVTRGDKGARALHHEYISTVPKVEVVDVTGAGDTFLSAFTFKYLETNDLKKSMDFANIASSITVQHFGCYAPTIAEIK